MKLIQQAITTESLFLELQRWCREGAARKRDKIQIISAFASGSAVEALEPFFDVFLSDGNSIDIIIGIDRNGTNKDAISRLYELQEAYSEQFSCSVFQAPSKIGIFHPKLYLYHSRSKLSAVTGSGNLTLGGLGNNFESLFLYRRMSIRSNEAKELVRTWDIFANPQKPLEKKYLHKLTRTYAQTLFRLLPRVSYIERADGGNGVKALWKPISKIQLPRSNERVQKQTIVSRVPMRAFLLIDVLTETRDTQMQLPLTVIETFFGFGRDQAGNIQLSYIRGGQITQPIERTLVISSGRNKKRLMRRIEMPQIAGKVRPLAAVFFRLDVRRFAVALVPRSTSGYSMVNDILESHGQQPEHAKRRYYIGASHDSLLRTLRPIFKPIVQSLVR